MTTVASTVKFQFLCELCENISLKQNKESKRKLLVNFITKWRSAHNELHKNNANSTTDSFYPAMRLLLPQFEKERPAYGIKETTLAKLYIDILCLSKNSQDAQKLLNFRNPKNAKGDAGDFAAIMHQVLKNRCPEKGTLSIADVNEHLDTVAATNSAQNKATMKRSLQFLLRNTSALEQKWLVRMIMKEMKMGLSEHSIFAAFHPDAKDQFNVSTSLEKVCTKLRSLDVRLHEMEVKLFEAFRPMLAEQASPGQIEKLKEKFYIETKFDGERTQIHKMNRLYKYYSRNGFDVTSAYGPSASEGPLTCHIDKCFSPEVASCILDGEMVGYNIQLDCIGSKGQGFDVKSLHSDEVFQCCFCVFDILMINNQVTTNKPYHERVLLLEKYLSPLPGRLMLSHRQPAQDKQAVIDALNKAIELREEGIVLKLENSIYKPNSRKGGWYKVKPEYVDSLMDELDLIILGGSFGEGRRQSLVSHFLLGLAAGSHTSETSDPKFITVAKVGSGYSLLELHELLARISPHWKVWDRAHPPSCIIQSAEIKERPDLWIPPQHSCILQIKASEIVPSERFQAGVTLRFPRVEKVRADKEWWDCMTLDQFQHLHQSASGKLARRPYFSELEDTSPRKKKNKLDIAVSSMYTGADTSSIQPVTNMFATKQFCIIVGPRFSPSKHDLEKQVVEHGGSVVQNPVDLGCWVVADALSLKAKNLISSGRYDVLKADWLLKCLDDKRLHPWKPEDFWHATPTTQEALNEKFDQWGDSFTEPLTLDQLKQVFAKPELQNHMLTFEEMITLEEEYGFHHASSLFRQMRLYCDDKAIIGVPETEILGHPAHQTALRAKLYGATLTSSIEDVTTHVLVHSKEPDHVKEFEKMNRERPGKFHLVTETWVADCIDQNCLLNERLYYPDCR